MDTPKLIAIVDRTYLKNDKKWHTLARDLLEAAPLHEWLCVQLRCKAPVKTELLQDLYERYADKTSCHWNLAQSLPGPVAHRHLPQRSPLPESGSFSRSIHSLNDLCSTPLRRPEWFQLAPIFSPTHKAGQPLGLPTLKAACQKSTIPIIAVGGITKENARSACLAGASGIGSIGNILSAPCPFSAAEELYNHFMGQL